VAPFVEDFDLQTQQTNPTNILLNWKQTGSTLLFAPYQFSDGTLRAIGLITLLMQPKAGLPRLIVLDEPELGLHPFAIELISAMIRSVSKSTQVIIATQSPQLVNEFEPEDVIVVSRHEGASVFKRLSRKELDAWLKDYTLGELWQKNVLEGGPNYQETRHA
jgi:predicted ATPase